MCTEYSDETEINDGYIYGSQCISRQGFQQNGRANGKRETKDDYYSGRNWSSVWLTHLTGVSNVRKIVGNATTVDWWSTIWWSSLTEKDFSSKNEILTVPEVEWQPLLGDMTWISLQCWDDKLCFTVEMIFSISDQQQIDVKLLIQLDLFMQGSSKHSVSVQEFW